MVDTRRGRNRGKGMGNKGGKRHGKVLGDNIQGITNNSKTEINNGQWTVEDEIQYREILEEEDEILQLKVVQGSIMMANKQEYRLMDFGDAEDEIDVKIIQDYNKMMMANKQEYRLMDFGDAEDEIDVKIIQDYNKMILEKKLHTSN